MASSGCPDILSRTLGFVNCQLKGTRTGIECLLYVPHGRFTLLYESKCACILQISKDSLEHRQQSSSEEHSFAAYWLLNSLPQWSLNPTQVNETTSTQKDYAMECLVFKQSLMSVTNQKQIKYYLISFPKFRIESSTYPFALLMARNIL